jgi:hypothetical protein
MEYSSFIFLTISLLMVMPANALVRVASDDWQYEPALAGYVFIGSQTNPLNEIRFLVGNNGGVAGGRVITVGTIPPSVGFINGTAGPYNIGAQLRNGKTTIEVPTAISELRLTPTFTGAAIQLPSVWVSGFRSARFTERIRAKPILQPTTQDTIIVFLVGSTWIILASIYGIYKRPADNTQVLPIRSVSAPHSKPSGSGPRRRI